MQLVRAWVRYAAVAMLVGGLALPGTALAAKDPTYRAHRGKIVFKNKSFQHTGDAEAFHKEVQAAAKSRTLVADKEGSWSFHFIAFLKRKPGSSKVNLVFYRKGAKKGSPIDFVGYDTGDPQALLLQASATLTSEAGFKPGDRIQALITRLVNGKEIRYAECSFTLN